MNKNCIKPLSLGGATLNVQYNKNPEDIPLFKILQTAIKSGICNSIDTSPYYGNSEILYGKVLQDLNYTQAKNPELRDSLFVVTKCGRIKENVFDYSFEAIKKSVNRSLERLFGSSANGEYLDLVYLHDVEFQTKEQVMEALSALKELKEEGKVLRIGCSGYPVEVLYDVCMSYLKKYGEPLDGILSYSNGCLQNNLFFNNWITKFRNDCQIKLLANGSILSMSMLSQSENGIKEFHPCQQKLKNVFDFNLKNDDNLEFAKILGKYDQRLPLLATKFAIVEANKSKNVTTVLGISKLSEWEDAEKIYKELEKNDFKLSDAECKCIEEIQTFLKANGLYNMMWASGYWSPQ
ncbi:Aldo/keto reductase [Hanseniaspora valbyensis NRRL Y-1626]|uniref:Aldo/keto reductase n=1 Tax=Hanseniaspora valbyensis NRRL Y-1626 TaxID=766949 RepID=A0A1B7TJ77_9ASCO|nr:Aldo/keto reductase [Hanseniaspora valbyensis NRRL Y-1626]